jgi:hypothetical protein
MNISSIDLSINHSHFETSKFEVAQRCSNQSRSASRSPMRPSDSRPKSKLIKVEPRSVEEVMALRLRGLRFLKFKEIKLGKKQKLVFAVYF